MLGHANALITAQVYNRFLPNLTRHDGSAMEKVLIAGIHETAVEDK
jgi:hypothetical protein